MTIPPKGPYDTLYSSYAGIIFQGSVSSSEETKESSSVGTQASPSTATEASQTSGGSTQEEIKRWEARCRNLETACQRLETRAQGAEEREALLQNEISVLSKELYESQSARESEKQESETKCSGLQAQLQSLRLQLDRTKRMNAALKQTLLGPTPRRQPQFSRVFSPSLRAALQAQAQAQRHPAPPVPGTSGTTAPSTSGQPPAKRPRQDDDDNQPGTSQD